MLLELKFPIKTETRCGLPAEITAINFASSDCLIGVVKASGKEIEVRWDASTIARNQPPDLNLNYPHDSTKRLLEVLSTANFTKQHEVHELI